MIIQLSSITGSPETDPFIYCVRAQTHTWHFTIVTVPCHSECMAMPSYPANKCLSKLAYTAQHVQSFYLLYPQMHHTQVQPTTRSADIAVVVGLEHQAGDDTLAGKRGDRRKQLFNTGAVEAGRDVAVQRAGAGAMVLLGIGRVEHPGLAAMGVTGVAEALRSGGTKRE